MLYTTRDLQAADPARHADMLRSNEIQLEKEIAEIDTMAHNILASIPGTPEHAKVAEMEREVAAFCRFARALTRSLR